MRPAALLLCLLSLIPCLGASAQAAQPAAAAPASAAMDEAAKAESQRRDTIRYGIDAEIIELVRVLGSERESRYSEDLLSVFQNSRSPKLRSTILDLFSTLEWRGAEKPAIALVEDRDNQDGDLVISALTYLAAIKSKDALSLSGGLISGNEKKYLPALVKLMGRAGGGAEEELLLGWFDSDSATPALKEEAIKALGDIGSAKAAERLGKLIQDAGAGKVPRMYACASLAKIKDPSSVDPLVKAANDADPNLRSSAVEALGAFAQAGGTPGEAARAAVTEALRDSYVNARIAACKSAASGQVLASLPFLRYKALSDPEKAVRIEALRSLAALGSSPGLSGEEGPFAFLRARLEDPKGDLGLRSLCYGLLCRYDPVGSMSVLKSRLVAEAQEKERGFYTILAREIANADKAPGIGTLAGILLSDRDYLIRIAGVEWIRKNKAVEFKPTLEQLAAADPADMIKKRAADALSQLQ